MTDVRFHPLYFTKYMRYGLILCVFPVVRALLVFDIAAAWIAFTQSALILLACALFSWMLWRHSGATFETASFSVRFGVFFRRTASYRNAQVSAVVVSRPPFCRICGAAKLTVYFKSEKPLASVNLVLSKDAAATFARRLVPAEKASSCFEPAGFDRLIFVMLSANIIATGALSVMTVYRVSRLLGQDFEAAAWNGLARATHLFSTWLPAGASAFVTLTLFFTLLSLLSSLASTTGFTVERSGAVLLCRGGLFTKTERRIFIASINVSSLHITPWARLLRCYPVYITAGGFRGHELPLISVRKGQEQTLARLLPEFCMPTKPMCSPRRKRIGSYLWKTGSVSGVLFALTLVSVYALPAMTLLLSLLFLFSLGALIISVEAFFCEGICKNDNRTFSLCYERAFTRYLVSVYTNDISFNLRMFPTAAAEGRCDLKVCTPAHITYTLRGIEYSAANRFSFNI